MPEPSPCNILRRFIDPHKQSSAYGEALLETSWYGLHDINVITYLTSVRSSNAWPVSEILRLAIKDFLEMDFDPLGPIWHRTCLHCMQ
jgi:hypothetical protein